MAIECPDYRTQKVHDDAPYCMACGRKFNTEKTRADGDWLVKLLAFCAVCGTLLAIFIVQRRLKQLMIVKFVSFVRLGIYYSWNPVRPAPYRGRMDSGIRFTQVLAVEVQNIRRLISSP